MEKILISACLLGRPVRYDGSDKKLSSDLLERWRKQGRLVSICPEVDAGLPTPRPAAEILLGDGSDVLENRARIIEACGADVTDAYLQGANLAVQTAQTNGCKHAILTDGSPSCGSTFIYDGSFTGVRSSGSGVTVALLRRAGIQVWSQHQLDDLSKVLKNDEDT